jgi:hypothetical protein
VHEFSHVGATPAHRRKPGSRHGAQLAQLARLRVEPRVDGGISFDGAGEPQKWRHGANALGSSGRHWLSARLKAHGSLVECQPAQLIAQVLHKLRVLFSQRASHAQRPPGAWKAELHRLAIDLQSPDFVGFPFDGGKRAAQ